MKTIIVFMLVPVISLLQYRIPQILAEVHALSAMPANDCVSCCVSAVHTSHGTFFLPFQGFLGSLKCNLATSWFSNTLF